MNDQTERLLAEFEENLYHAIKAALELTRGEVDINALAEAIASGDESAIVSALGIAQDTLRQRTDETLPILFDTFFTAVAIIAFTALGYPTHTLERTALVVRDNLRFRITSELATINTAAAMRSVALMASNAEPPRTVASHLIQNIGLSDGQQKSLDTFRSMLVRGQRRNTTYFPSAQLQRLNASQRSILRSIVPGEVTADDIERLTSQQRKSMTNHRAQTMARTKAYELHHAAQQSAWEQLDRDRLIDGYRRFWIHAGDERVRHTHRAVPGLNDSGVGLQQPFQTPLGPAHSPPLEINCRCHVELRKPSP